MKTKKPGIFRVLSLFLALLILVNLPISAFASETAQEGDVATVATDAVPTEMLTSNILKALLYLKYDSNSYLRNNGLLFQKKYIGGKLEDNYPAALTGIKYANGGGTATITSGGKTVPDIDSFKANGMVCTSFIEYYYLNYLRHIAGASDAELKSLSQTIEKAYDKSYELYLQDEDKYPDMWSTTGELLTTDAYGKVAKKTTLDKRYTGSYTTAEYQAFFDKLSIGTLVQFGGNDYTDPYNDYVHYAVYAGKYNDEYYIIHVGNNRGPEITLARYMEQSDSKTSWPIAAYDFNPDAYEQYGSIKVFKSDPDGKPLAGAKFLILNTETGEDYTVTTDSTGYATKDELPLGTYTIQETSAPSGYLIDPTVYTITLTEAKPDGGGPIHVIDRKNEGSLKIIKNILPSTAAIPENLAGWQFTVHSNYSFYKPALNATTKNNKYRVKVYDKFGDMVESNTVSVSYSPITAHPQDASVSSGSAANFSITTSGTGLTYQWQYSANGGKTWYDHAGKTTTTYAIAMSEKFSGYQVRCKVTDASGTVYYSNAATAYLNTTLAIMQQPKDAAIRIGSSASFTVKANGSNLSYMWYVSDDGGTTWTQLNAGTVSGNASTYTTPTATADTKYHRMFKCVVSDGTNSIETKAVNCYRTDGYDADGSYKGITIVENLVSTTGLLNTMPWIGTVVSGDGICYEWEMYDPTTGTWSMMNAARWTATTGADGTAQLDNIMSGTYFVREVNTGKDGWVYDGIPRAVTITADNTTVLPVAASFINKAYGSLKIFKDILPDTAAVPENLAGWQFTVHVNNPYLTLDPATESGQYRVKVTDKFGNTVISDAATVGYSPIVEHPKDVFLALDKGAPLTVTTVGTGYTYVWQYSDDDGVTWRNTTATGSTVNVQMKDFRHMWFYRCQVTDANGNVYHSEPARMYYNTDLAITKQPKNALIEVGGTASFSAEAHGSNLLSSWSVSDDGGKTWSDISNGLSSDGDTYTYTTDAATQNTPYQKWFRYEGYNGDYITSDIVSWYRADGYDDDGTYQGVVIANQPQSTFGPSVTLNVAASGDDLIYEWERYDEESGTWELVNTAVNDAVYTTDQEGVIQIDNLPADNYFVREVNDGRPGWEYDTQAKLVTVTPNNTTSLPAKVTFTNTIVKSGFKIQKTTEDGKNLEGWLFNVYADEDCNILIAENERTNEEGLIVISDLTYGTYWVEEVCHEDPEIDELYVCDSENPQSVEVYADSDETVEFYNKLKYGSLEVQKKVNVDGYLGGWQFDVYVGSVAPENRLANSPFTTDDNGYCLIEKLLPGKYIVVERGIESEYWVCDTEEHEVNVEAGTQPAYVELENTVYSKLQIKKVTTDGSSPVGYKFHIYFQGKCLTEEPIEVTDESGIINVPGLFVPGTYSVEEVIDADDPYEVIDGKTKTITVKPEETATFTFTNAPKVGNLVIKKQTNTGSDKNGWKYNVYFGSLNAENLIDGSPFEIVENGELVIENLPIGLYIVEEINDGKSFWIYDTEKKAGNVPHNGQATVTFKNTQYGELQIKKTTTDGSSPVDYQFNIYDPNGNLMAGSPFTVKNEDGTITGIQITVAGIYKIEEILPADSLYEVDGENPVFVSAELGKVNEFVVFTNKPKAGTLVIQKDTNTGNNKNGWFFNVYRGSVSAKNLVAGSPFEIPNKDGVLTIENLPIDTYIVVEVNDSKDFWIYDLEEKTVTVPHNDVGTATFENTQYGYLQLKKVTTDGSSVKDYQFNVYDPNGEIVAGSPFTTDADGLITNIQIFEAGQYRIEEILADDSAYEVDGENPVFVNAELGKVNEFVTITNKLKVGSLKITKQTNTGDNLNGWKFNIYRDSVSAENLVNEQPLEITNENGELVVENLPIGTYIVVEVNDGKDLWIYDVEEKTVAVPHNGVGEAEPFVNTHMGRAKIKKVAPSGGTVEGWKFKIEAADGTSLGIFTTDAEGFITETLAPGVYTVTEIGHDSENLDYWVFDAEPTKTVTVLPGDTEVVEYVNDWYGGGTIHKEMSDGSSPVGIQFEVTDMDGTPIPGSPFTITDPNGDVNVGLLVPGKYIVKEIVPEGSLYQPVGTNPKTLMIAGGENTIINFVNALPSASLTAEKVDPTGRHLMGAKFLLEWSADDGATWSAVTYNSTMEVVLGGCTTAELIDGTLTTGADGIVVFDGLHPDLTYRLTEVQAPNGYMLLGEPAFVGKLPTPDYKKTIVVTNSPVIDIPETGDNTDHIFAISIFAFVVVILFTLGCVVLTNYPLIPDRRRR